MFWRKETLMDIQEKLKNYLLMELAADLGIESLSAEDDLLEQGIIDSMGIMNVIAFIEEQFEIAVEDQEIVPENFQTIKNMEQFIGQKQQA